METVRAFVGCLLDLATTRRVMELQRGVRKNAEAAGFRAAWVPPPNLHITLKYLGDTDIGLLEPLSEIIGAVAAKHAAIRVDVNGLGAFPEQGDPQVIFAEFARGHERLRALAKDLDDALLELGLPTETRGFHPHVTLARIKVVPPGRTVGDLRPTGALLHCGTASIQEVSLYRSDLTREGSEYQVLVRRPLGSD